MLNLSATEDYSQIYNVVRPTRVCLNQIGHCVEYGLMYPDGTTIWTWLNEKDARSSTQYRNTAGMRVISRHWVQVLKTLDLLDTDYVI